MPTEQTFYLGVIEGFYGRSWSDSSRLTMMPWLSALGFSRFMYAPKSDAGLRKAWKKPLPADSATRLKALSARCAESHLESVVGLSPYALYENYDRRSKQLLRDKVESIIDLGAHGLGLLFDDMPGDIDQLAARQLEICADVDHWMGGGRLLVCPTYYSTDTVLDRVFGERPSAYVNVFCQDLPTQAEVFWTGPEVCSTEVSVSHLREVAAEAGRPLALWDNYPVNDSKARSDHLYLGPVTGREEGAQAHLSSHWSNAMNQPALSLPALASFPRLYDGAPAEVEGVLRQAGITPAMLKACACTARAPRAELSDEMKSELLQLAAGSTMAAMELRDWLAGEYQFDPACLTD